MARPSKYDWDSIKEAYIGGIDRDTIISKFNIPSKRLSEKLSKENWEVKGNLKADIDEFSKQWTKTTENLEKVTKTIETVSDPVAEIMIDKINTQVEDNELIANNRKLAKMLQGVIVANRGSITLKNIRNVSGVLRDIEALANPVSSRIELNNNVNNSEETQYIITYE